MNQNHYQVLQVDPSATMEDIRRAYQREVLLTHPDKTGGVDRGFSAVQDAWRTLGDGRMRAQYDEELRRVEREAQRERVAHLRCRAEDMAWDEGRGALTMRCRCGGEFVLCQEDVDGGVCIVPCSGCSYKMHIVCD